MRRSSLLLSGAILTAATHAHAGPEDSLGASPRSMALAGSYAARPGDAAASYYNPGGLAPGRSLGDAEKGGFFEGSAALVYAHSTLHVTRLDGANLSTPNVPDTIGLVIGTRFSLGRLFHIDGLDMGLNVFLPTHLFQWSIRPDDDMQWSLLTDRTQVFSAHSGISYRVTPWLSLGVGLRVLFGAQTLTKGLVTSVGLETDPVTGKSAVKTGTQLGTDAEVFGRVSPSAGVLITPIDRLRIGLVYRHKSYVDDWGNTRISGVPDIGDMGYTHHYAHYFEPSEVTVAASADLMRGLDVSFDLTYNRWRDALSTNRNDLSGAAIWGDTWTPAFGVRYRPAPILALMTGYRFQKSPLDNFGGPTNLLDADRHVVGLGFELSLGSVARAIVGVQYTSLVTRSETKDSRRFQSDAALVKNAGYPSYAYGGHVMATSVGVEGRW